ncbi:MAG: hypothetical protein AAF500_03815 [Myxococcota bacterium]
MKQSQAIPHPSAAHEVTTEPAVVAWNRSAPRFCIALVAVGMSLGSPAVIWSLAGVALASVLLPHHPVDSFYNLVVRRYTKTASIPPSTRDRRVVCLVVAALLISTGAAFLWSFDPLGYGLGVAAKLCIRFHGHPDVLSIASRVLSAILRFV